MIYNKWAYLLAGKTILKKETKNRACRAKCRDRNDIDLKTN